jgi:hypothetical protein
LSVAASHRQRVIQEEPSNGEKTGTTLLDGLGGKMKALLSIRVQIDYFTFLIGSGSALAYLWLFGF